MPPGFFGADVGTMADVFLPIGAEPLIRGRDSALDRSSTSWLLVMARLKDGQTIASAEQALRSIQPQFRDATMPDDAGAERRARYLATPFRRTTSAMEKTATFAAIPRASTPSAVNVNARARLNLRRANLTSYAICST